MKITLLAIDDDPGSLALVAASVEQPELEILTCSNPVEALDIVRDRLPRIVICDLMMPEMTGIQVLEQIQQIDPTIDVILLTGHYSTESALEAIRKGACDYLVKPIAPDKLLDRVNQILSETRRLQDAAELDQKVLDTNRFHGMFGRSPVMLDVFRSITRLAPHFRTLLITGATGTGKELVARALHHGSPVSKGPFAICNCAALPESLIESELFGYARGAFTGAVQDKPGLFEHAHNGTLFLDEIGELPLTAQAKILRAAQHQELQRLGSPTPRKVNVRIIAATHRDLRRMTREQTFREDLLYRIAMIEIKLPLLRERGDDLPFLIRHFVSVMAAQYGKKVLGVTRRAEAALLRYSWPGNIRELEGVLGAATLMTDSSLIDIADLPPQFRERSLQAESTDGDDLLISLAEAERRHALRVLEKLGGDKVAAAQVLGVSRATLYRLIAQKSSAAGRGQ